jgi:hypothetical protein
MVLEYRAGGIWKRDGSRAADESEVADLIDRRSSPTDLIADSQPPSRNARRLQAKEPRKLRMVR